MSLKAPPIFEVNYPSQAFIIMKFKGKNLNGTRYDLIWYGILYSDNTYNIN